MHDFDGPYGNIGELPPLVKAKLEDIHKENLKYGEHSNLARSTTDTSSSNHIESPLRIAGHEPLLCARDPRRNPLLNRTPLAPLAEPRFQSRSPSKRIISHSPGRENTQRSNASDKKLFGKNDITPAYAYKNAESGLLEIRSIVPPHPDLIDAEDKVVKIHGTETKARKTRERAIPALYPIALNGGGIGIYRNPRDFASGRVGSLSYNQRDPSRIATRSFISFPWNFGDTTDLGREQREESQGGESIVCDNVAIDKSWSSNDEETGPASPEQHPNVKRNSESELYKSNNNPSPFSPWKVWERVHNYMVDVAERTNRIPKKLHFQDDTNPRSSTEGLSLVSASARRKKMRLSTIYNEDDYDFVLVLKPKLVYKYWAELLDFRAEYGLEDSIGSEDDDSTEHKNMDMNDNQATNKAKGMGNGGALHTLVDAEPYPIMSNLVTPLGVGKKRRRGEISSEKKTRTASSSSRLKSGTKYTGSLRHSSLFEKALASLSPPRPSEGLRDNNSKTIDPTNLTSGETIINNSTLDATCVGQNLLKASAYTRGSPMVRRKWGGRLSYTIPTSGSKPSPSLQANRPPLESVNENKRDDRFSVSRDLISPSTSDRKETRSNVNKSKRRRKPHINTLRIEDIPRQVVPRGIAARSHGMEEFLSALKIGIVVRKHRPKAPPTFVKLSSSDGGDTIQISYVPPDDARIALKEQRIRCNKGFDDRQSSSTCSPTGWSSSWSLTDSADDAKVSLPDYIAAEKYRGTVPKVGLSQILMDAALKATNAGSVKASEIIAVHPAIHSDPFSPEGHCGTSTLRDSTSQYKDVHTFSIILPAINFTLPTSRTSLKQISERWYAGSGSEKTFRYLDLEAATEGEYWLIFRGFLLLHRDATYGRFAAQRASGFSSKYSKLEIEQISTVFKPFGVDPLPQFNEPEEETLFLRIMKMCSRSSDRDKTADLSTPEPPPSDYFLGFKSTGTQIWSRLRLAGLETQRIYALDSRKVMIKIRCPPDRLTDVAEVLRFKLKTIDGYYVPFREGMANMFLSAEECKTENMRNSACASLFKSSDRQRIIDFIIRSRIRDTGAELGQRSDLGKDIAIRLPLHMHSSLEALYHVWICFYREENWDILMKESCYDQQSQRNRSPVIRPPPLVNRIVTGSFRQPLDSIERYFGERVAFYFAWMQHISLQLILPSIVGGIVFILQVRRGRIDIPVRPYFSTFIMLWSFYVMVSWRQRQNYLAHRWGTLNYKEEETTRPQHYGEYQKCKITGEWIVYYPSWKRWSKYIISISLTLISTFGFSLLILILYANRDIWLARFFGDHETGAKASNFDWSWHAIGKTKSINSVQLSKDVVRDPHFWYINAGFPALMGLLLPIFNFFLFRISITLNDFENHRTESQYRNALIIKIFASRFVAYFAALYYYTFLSIGRDTKGIQSGLLRVATSLFVYLTVSQWWNVFLIIYVPLLYQRWKLHSNRMKLRYEIRDLEALEMESTDTSNPKLMTLKERRKKLQNKRILLEHAQSVVWEELILPQYDPFFDYVQAVMHFAYAACFSSVLPIAPAMILMNNLISMRLNAFKICRGRSRPLSIKTGGIGVWENVLHIVTVVGVLTNCYLTAWTDSQFLSYVKNRYPGNSDTILFLITIIWEHFMLLLKYIFQSSFAKYPKSVSEDMQRESHEKSRWRSHSMRVRNGRRSGSYPQPPAPEQKSDCSVEHKSINSIRVVGNSDSDDDENIYSEDQISAQSHSSTLRKRSPPS